MTPTTLPQTAPRLLSTRYSVLGTRYSVLGTRYSVLGTPHSALRTLNPQPSTLNLFRPAFTLTELLIVMGIIVVVVGLAVPAYNFITGSRSQESAVNLIASMLGQARSLAISQRRCVGLLVYRDPDSDRTALRLVGQEDPDAPHHYAVWTSGITYRKDDSVIYLLNVNNDGSNGSTARTAVRRFRARIDTSATPKLNPKAGDPWFEVHDNELYFLDAEPQYLPTGVGAQLLSDPVGDKWTTPNAINSRIDRYVQTGVVLFNPRGQFIRSTCAIVPDTPPYDLFQQIEGATWFNGTRICYRKACYGFALYDLTTFRAQPNFTDGSTSTAATVVKPDSLPDRIANNESTEEQWLDNNTTLLLISRTTGQLLKGE